MKYKRCGVMPDRTELIPRLLSTHLPPQLPLVGNSEVLGGDLSARRIAEVGIEGASFGARRSRAALCGLALGKGRTTRIVIPIGDRDSLGGGYL